jgi:hypothetical protein
VDEELLFDDDEEEDEEDIDDVGGLWEDTSRSRSGPRPVCPDRKDAELLIILESELDDEEDEEDEEL